MELEAMPRHGKPMGRRERKKIDTRRRIFRAAFDLFRVKGFDGTTVEEIAEEADVAKGTVFNYFPQKTAFLLAAYGEWVNLLVEELGPVSSWTGPTRVQLSRAFAFLVRLSQENRILARQVLLENLRQTHLRMAGESDMPREDGGGETEGEGMEDDVAMRALEDMTRDVIQRGIESGEIRGEVDEEMAASLIALSGFQTIVRGLVRGQSTREIEGALASKMDIIFTGLTP